MDDSVNDLIYLLFSCYNYVPHILVTNQFIFNSYSDMNTNKFCCKYAAKLHVAKYYNNYRNLISENANIKFAYKTLNDKNVCIMLVSNFGNSLVHIPENILDYEICIAAVSIDGRSLRNVPALLIDYKMCYAAVSEYGCTLRRVPDKFKDYIMCMAAVFNDGAALEYVNDELKDYIMCYSAVTNNSSALKYVPRTLKNYHLIYIKSIKSAFTEINIIKNCSSVIVKLINLLHK